MAYTIDSAIITVIISAATAFGIFGLKERWIEPRRWKKNVEIANLEKKLEVYGTLTTLLQSFYEKAHRRRPYEEESSQTDNNNSHSLELPYDANKLDEIFEKSRYLLSDELIKKYLQFIGQDTYLQIYNARKKR